MAELIPAFLQASKHLRRGSRIAYEYFSSSALRVIPDPFLNLQMVVIEVEVMSSNIYHIASCLLICNHRRVRQCPLMYFHLGLFTTNFPRDVATLELKRLSELALIYHLLHLCIGLSKLCLVEKLGRVESLEP